MKTSTTTLMLALCLSTLSTATMADEVGSVTSPDGQNTLAIDRSDSGQLTYTVTRGTHTLVAASPLGLVAREADLSAGLALSAHSTRPINEQYALPTGKCAVYHNTCNELTLIFTKGSHTLALQCRAYDDGVAFRYVVNGDEPLTVTADKAEVNLPSFERCWAQRYVTDYSQPYPARSWSDLQGVSDNTRKLCVPALVKSTEGDDCWVLLTESQGDAQFCASALVAGDTTHPGCFSFALQDTPTVGPTFTTPWRTLYMGTLATIVESNLNDDLNPATSLTDTSWIQAGLSSWDWGGEDGQERHDLNIVKDYIDMAHNMHWPYYTLDAGWDGAPYALADVTAYAASKGVKVFIWSHQNRFRNDEEQIRSILSEWKRLGFAGVKIDFFEDDRKAMMEKYEKLLKVAAEQQLMVNFHGCTRPTGLRRTWPNLITSEAVYGGEQYYFNHLATPATHNITLALTRNVIGAMDYTPVEFARKDGVLRHLTTWSHQVALATLYESGIQTMSDSRQNLTTSPAAPLLGVLPAAWDETRCLEASPDQYVTVARRKGDDWYVASIANDERDVTLPLQQLLGDGTYTAQIYKDGTCPSDIAYDEQPVTAASTLALHVKATGGFTVRLTKTPHTQPAFQRIEAEEGTVSDGTTIDTDAAGLCSGGKMVGFLGQGHTVTCTAQTAADGTYRLTLFYITQDTRRLYIQVNGGEKVYHELQGNGFSWNSDGMAMRTFSVQLKKGDNTICLGNDEGYAPNIDRMVLSPAPTSHTLAVGTLTPCTDGVYGAETDIALTVTNPTDQPISDVQLAYQVDDQPVVTETLPLLPAAQATVYTFAHKADLSAMGTHRLRAWTVTDDARLLDGDLATASLFALPAGEQNVSAASAGGTIHSKSAQVSDGEGADKLLDGDDATKWCDNASAEPWVVVALPHACMVGHFLIRDCKTREQGFHNLSDYKIYVTADDDPSTALWTCVVDAQGAQADDIHIHALPQPVAARYVKLVAQRPEGDNAIRLYAFDVYGTSADTPSGIGVPTASAATSATVYNMAGQRMATATRGLKPGVYVVDGKKMVVRFK